jgi:hypothetical protein
MSFRRGHPKTRHAKVMRRIVRVAHIGEKLGDILTFENPASIEEIQADGQR